MKTFNAEKLFVSNLNGVDSKNFMTRTTDQTIESQLKIKHSIMKSNMIVNLINDINPSQDIVTVKNPVVKGIYRYVDSITLHSIDFI